MSDSSTDFPLSGIIGVVSESKAELEIAVHKNLRCIEIRADLLLSNKHSVGDLMQVVRLGKEKGLACLFTLRHDSQGGTWNGSESDRADLNRQALVAGASMLDIEWDMPSSRELLAEGAPVILSYHNFNAMEGASELAALTLAMEKDKPRAIKIIPTADTINDSIRMLNWVSNAKNDIKRIGFSMGGSGETSRILTTIYGCPVTYTSFGKPVAPGQIALDDLCELYRINDLNTDTEIIGIVEGNQTTLLGEINNWFKENQVNSVGIPINELDFDIVKSQRLELRMQRMVISNTISMRLLNETLPSLGQPEQTDTNAANDSSCAQAIILNLTDKPSSSDVQPLDYENLR